MSGLVGGFSRTLSAKTSAKRFSIRNVLVFVLVLGASKLIRLHLRLHLHQIAVKQLVPN